MNKLVKVVLVACAQINEGLHGLVRVGRGILPLGALDHRDRVVSEQGEVSDAAIDIGGLVHPDEWLVEDGEEITEQLEGDGLLDDAEHHRLVALAGVQLQKLLHVGEPLSALLHLQVDIVDGMVPCHPTVEHFADLLRGQLGRNELRAQDGDNEVDVFRLGLFSNDVLNILFGIHETLEFLGQDSVVNLRSQRINRFLEILDAFIQRHRENSLQERP